MLDSSSHSLPQSKPAHDCHHSSSKAFIKFEQEDIEQSIANRFEQQVLLQPNNIAIKSKNQETTYQQLNNTANCLANTLLSSQGQKEESIVLLLEKEACLIASMFAVLKLGKTYITLDTTFPLSRLKYMLSDSQAKLIITNNNNLALANGILQEECQILNIDEIDYSNLSRENLNLSVSPDSLAYILYTSGSTGNPKGIAHNHRNTLHNVRRSTNTLYISSEDRITFLHASGVMSATRGIFSTLLNGATLYPFDINESGLIELNQLLIQEKMTIYYSVPTLFRNVVNSMDDAEKLPNLRLIILTGEPVVHTDVELCQTHFSDNCMLATGLGTSETGSVTLCCIGKDTEINNSTAPLGFAVEGVDIRLLDEKGAEVEVGEIGEIVIKSRYIAQGYWNKPELSQAVFKQNTDHKYTYYTGDLGRKEADGCLFHHGRKDFQVKIRGNRIELSEIEMALQKHSLVKNVIVTAIGESQDDKRLVAYLIYHENTPENNLDIIANTIFWEFLQEKLPVYMIPAFFIRLNSFPLTPNGKTDRRALPVPEMLRSTKTDFVPASTETEKLLASTWSQVLKIEQIGIHDSFFELGGHSLLATQIISRIKETFPVQLSLADLFETPTIEALAEKITTQLAEDDETDEMSKLLMELENLSDDEVKQLLE